MNTLALRRVNPQLHLRSQAVKRWQRDGLDAGLGSPDRQQACLCFTAEGGQGQWQGIIDARAWLNQSLPQLQSLLAAQCPLGRIAELFRAIPRPLQLQPQELHYRTLSAVEWIEPGALPVDLPWLATSRGTVWLTRLPSPCAMPVDLHAQAWLRDVPQRLKLLLGRSDLSLCSLLRLAPGDVLRLTRQLCQCWLAQRCIGVFTFTKEGLLMETRVVDVPAMQAQAQAGIELHELPVHLEFVLASREVRLVELANIMAGQLITLAADAVQHIEIRANGRAVARGELVQLDGQLGVELLEVYRNPRDE